MEKRKPTYLLADIQAAAPEKMAFTQAALRGGAAMGMTRKEMVGVIQRLTRRDFYKSMTSYHDHRVWMDVYHGRSDGYLIYIKFVQDVVTDFTCTSFKER